jgi:hypothetical protein
MYICMYVYMYVYMYVCRLETNIRTNITTNIEDNISPLLLYPPPHLIEHRHQQQDGKGVKAIKRRYGDLRAPQCQIHLTPLVLR